MQQPTFAELAAALKSLHNPEPQGLNRHVQTIVVAAALGIGAWLLNGLNTVQGTLMQVSTRLEAVQTATSDMSRRIDTIQTQQSDMKSHMATTDQRVTALERSRTGGVLEEFRPER